MRSLKDTGLKLLVTGGSGFVGQALLRSLGDTPVHIASRADLANWSSVLKGVNVVVHLAARVHVMHDSAADPLAAWLRLLMCLRACCQFRFGLCMQWRIFWVRGMLCSA